MKYPRHIFLIGFSGSGKSSVGPLLAKRLGVDYVDTDSLIEKRVKKSISEIFAHKGEAAFRKLERDAIEKLVIRKARPRVISLGGGACQDRRNRRLIESAGITVYLRCAIPELYRRLKQHSDRPLLRVRNRAGETPREATLRRIRSMLDKRRCNYESADIVVSTTSRTPVQAARETVRKLEAFDGSH